MVEEGKEEIRIKRLKETEGKEWDNPYDRLVHKVSMRQREDLERIKNNKQLFNENIQRNNQLQLNKKLERQAHETL